MLWDLIADRKFIYDGWNIIREDEWVTSKERTYTWGLDLTGSLTKSGGVGALLAIRDTATSKRYLPGYDANGNVAVMVNAANGTIEAAYEYGPFGESLRADGDYAEANPIRFSTKYTDEETDLVYYGRRYYDPKDGRFVGRDPIEEQGGINLLAFVANNTVNSWDYLGMECWMSAGLYMCDTDFLSPSEYGNYIDNLDSEVNTLVASNINVYEAIDARNQAFIDNSEADIIARGSPTANTATNSQSLSSVSVSNPGATTTGNIKGVEVTIGGLQGYTGANEGTFHIPSPIDTSSTGASIEAQIWNINNLETPRATDQDLFMATMNSFGEDADIYHTAEVLTVGFAAAGPAIVGATAVGTTQLVVGTARVAAPIIQDGITMIGRDGRAIARAAGEMFDDVGRYIYTRSPSTVDFVEGVVWSAGIAGDRSGYHGLVPSGANFSGGQFAGLINIDEWAPGD